MDKSKTGKNMKARLLQMSLGHLYAVLDAKTIRNVFKWRILQKHRDREPNDDDDYDDIWFWCIAWHHCRSPCSTLNLIKKDTRNAIHTKVAYFSLSSRTKNLSLCWWVVAMVHIFYASLANNYQNRSVCCFSLALSLRFFMLSPFFFSSSSDHFSDPNEYGRETIGELTNSHMESQSSKELLHDNGHNVEKKWTFFVKCVVTKQWS